MQLKAAFFACIFRMLCYNIFKVKDSQTNERGIPLAALSDDIEFFIKSMLEDDNSVDLQRNELAHHFSCAPSQINYVLATRFTIEHGYIIESRRGGGGFIRVLRVTADPHERLINLINNQIGSSISVNTAKAVIGHLHSTGLINQREARLMFSAVNDKALMLPASIKDSIRAAILKSMITTLMLE